MKSKNLIKLILKEELSKILNEDITSGSAIVYHRTGINGSPIEGIAADGFRVGSGAYYGVGVYTTYTLQSQLNEYMYEYGNIIIECKVNSLDKYLIFDYDIAKKIYGNKNHTLDRQLKLILNKEWNKYKNNELLNHLIEKIPSANYTSQIAKPFYDQFKDTIVKQLNGIIFTGSRDGNVLVAYNRKNVEPIRYSEDEGKTWTNVLNKNIYQRIKNFNPKENTTFNIVLNNLETNNLSITDVHYIENNLNQFIDAIKHNNTFSKLLAYASNPDNISNTIINIKGDKLNSDAIDSILQFSNNKKLMAEKIIDAKGKKLTDNMIILILDYLDNSNEIAEKIINQKSDNLNTDDVVTLIRFSKNPRIIANLIDLNMFYQYLISSDYYELDSLLKFSRNSNEIIELIVILFIENNKEKLDFEKLKLLLKYYSDTESLSKLYINLKDDDLNQDDLLALLIYSKKPTTLAKIIGIDKFNKLLSWFDPVDIKLLIQYSINPDEIKNILTKANIKI